MIRKIDRSEFKYKKELSFDPDDVNVRLQHFRISEIVKLIDTEYLEIFKDADIYPTEEELDAEEIDIESEDEMQRKANLWNNVQKSLFIESLMIRLPIPMFYLDGTTKPWRVIDGLQRLTTIISFLKNEFKLTSLEYLGDICNNLTFEDSKFPGYLKSRIMDAQITAYVVNPGTPEDVKYNIFQRINTGGLKLNGQEIRNAIFKGRPAQLTKELALEESFIAATNGKITPRRMIDREYANRFIAFQIFNFHDYNGKMDLFLSEALFDLYKRENNEIEELKQLFRISMQRCYEIFEGNAFYRPKPDFEWGKSPNKAIFDTLSWNLLEITEEQLNNIISNRDRFKERYFKFMNEDEVMFKSIDNTTGSKNAVINRFYRLKDFLNSFL
jgi:hypothetical protein